MAQSFPNLVKDMNISIQEVKEHSVRNRYLPHFQKTEFESKPREKQKHTRAPDKMIEPWETLKASRQWQRVKILRELSVPGLGLNHPWTVWLSVLVTLLRACVLLPDQLWVPMSLPASLLRPLIPENQSRLMRAQKNRKSSLCTSQDSLPDRGSEPGLFRALTDNCAQHSPRPLERALINLREDKLRL